MPVHLIVYSSTSLIAPAYADREIADIVTKSIEQNSRYAVTGALLYSDGRRFAQALEGDAAAVHFIMAKIRNDSRHSQIVMLHDGAVLRRRFPDWTLAFRDHDLRIDHAISAAEYEADLISNKALEELLETMEYLVGQPQL